MDVTIRRYKEEDRKDMIRIWNDVVEEGIAFPQLEVLNEAAGTEFFYAQSYCGVAEDSSTKEILGLYILHPNNIGRCGHIANASYAVKAELRGCRIGEKLVRDSVEQGGKLGFRILQFNAVVKTNAGARHLYEKLGFIPLGTITEGFLKKDGTYEDIIPYYMPLRTKAVRKPRWKKRLHC